MTDETTVEEVIGTEATTPEVTAENPEITPEVEEKKTE
jgi:hypothetical protein